MEKEKPHNCNKSCWNCPAAIFKGNVDFRACGQSKKDLKKFQEKKEILIECGRRPELGHFEPSITFEQCPEWEPKEFGYKLKDMKVMILGIDGYLGWALALKLGKLGFKVCGIDNLSRRECVAEKGAHSILPLSPITERVIIAKEKLGIDIKFKKMDILDYDELKQFLEEEKPHAVVHYGEIPSAPYSMVDHKHAIKVQRNNVLGTLGLLFAMKETIPESCLVKLGTMGEYGAPLTGRPIFEGIFPADSVLKWNNREWSLGGEITPRDPVSFYHVSKVQDTFNVYEACKYWWLRSYDVMQGVIYGVHTEEVAIDPKLRTRFDVDEWFGTAINRFAAQAAIGLPITIYGTGQQIRGFIALEDAMQCMARLIVSPPEPGQYDVVNQVSGLHKISDIAEAIAKVGKEKFNLDVKINRVENPRVESEQHPLEVVAKKLPKKFGFIQKITPEKEIERILRVLVRPEIAERVRQEKEALIPKTRWDGDERESEVLESYNPQTKEKEGFTGILKKE